MKTKKDMKITKNIDMKTEGMRMEISELGYGK